MFWVVTTSSAFCTISLADILVCVATDQHPWTWKGKKSGGVSRTLSPRKKNRSTTRKLRYMWSFSILHHFSFIRRRMTESAGSRLVWGITKHFLCSCYSESKRAIIKRDIESVLDMNTETFGPAMPPSISNIDFDTYTSALSPQEIRRYTDEQIYDIQFSPDGEWVAVCSTVNCHAIRVRSEVSFASNGEIDGITKKISRLDLQLGVNDLPISYDK